jgi:hypothetical protein
MAIGGLMGVLVSSWAGVAAAAPKHQGFTGDLSIGPSLVLVPHKTYSECVGSGCAQVGTTSETTREAEFGLAGLSVSLGGYVTPEVALVARLAGTSYFDEGDQFGNNFYGGGVEVWPNRYLFLGAGLGLGVYGPNPLVSSSTVDPVAGFALDFRVGTALAQGTNHDFILGFEVLPAFYEDGTVVGFGLTGGWKWY